MKTMILAFSALAVLTACSSGEESAKAEPEPGPAPYNPGKTRVESYRGIEVTVPAAWGTSVAPTAGDDGDLLDCGSGVPTQPSVGRPGMTSDACQIIDDLEPTAPFVWLGVELDDATHKDGDFTVETRTVGGVPVTVASANDAEREAILDSVTEVDAADKVDSNGCSVTSQPATGLSPEGLGNVHGMSVCVYSDDQLIASWRRGADRAKRFTDALYAGQDRTSRCTSRAVATVEIVVDSDDDFGKPGAHQHPRFVVDPMCGTVSEPHGTNIVLTKAMVAPWHDDLVRSHVPGAYDSPLRDYFKMPMG